MSEVKITYYGHSCFKVEDGKSSIILDPYENGSVPGIKLPKGLEADIVSCSHQHGDHNARELVKTTGNKPDFIVSKATVPHDHHDGSHRGFSDITFIHMQDLLVVHLGDLGRLPTKSEYEELGKADVILIPCAGYFTIDSKEANEVIKHLKKPSLKILMHFREGKKGYDVQEDIKDVAKDIKGIHRLDKSTITVDSGNVPDKIITLVPIQ